MPVAAERYRGLAAVSAAKWGQHFGVRIPVEWVLAMIMAESSGDPRAVGDNGRSRGLLQVLDTTAAEMGLADPRRLFDPATGIDYGVRYYAKQVARYGGNLMHGVAAYNGGSVAFDERERYRNQGHVDKVLGWLRSIAPSLAPEPGAPAPAPLGLLPLAGLFALGALLAFVKRGNRRGRRAA